MRVADRSTARNYLKYLNKSKSDLAATQLRIASGNRFTQVSDDVASATRVLRARQNSYKTEKQLDNIKSINEELSSAENALTSINDVLSDILGTKLEKVLNEPTGEEGFNAIANEIKAMREEILQFANAKYGNKYLFGGTNAGGAPFTVDETTGKLLYNGINVDEIKEEDGSYYYIQKDAAGNDEKVNIPMDGDIYMDIGLGIKIHSNWTDPNTGAGQSPNVVPSSGFLVSYSGIDILGFGVSEDGKPNNLYNILTDIENNIRDYDKEALGEYHTHLNNRYEEFRGEITDIGARTNYLDAMEDRLKKDVDSYKVRIQDLMGIDDAEEASRLDMQNYVWKAVLQMGAQILPVSLMDFIS